MNSCTAGSIVRGCTPTIRFTYPNVPINAMAVAILFIEQGDVVIEKTLDDCVKGDKSLTWTLSQEETLRLRTDSHVAIQVRYRLYDGTAGASRIYEVLGGEILKDGVI